MLSDEQIHEELEKASCINEEVNAAYTKVKEGHSSDKMFAICVIRLANFIEHLKDRVRLEEKLNKQNEELLKMYKNYHEKSEATLKDVKKYLENELNEDTDSR